MENLVTLGAGPPDAVQHLKPPVDPTTLDYRELLESLLAYGDLEGREALLGRTGRAGIVTDDNMLPEFREPLRYPKLE